MGASIFPNPDVFRPEYPAERKFFNAVKGLNSSWTAFFNASKGIGKEESDCVLVHKTYGVFSVEVKGGSRFRIQDGQWGRLESGGYKPITNPLSQAENIRGNVLRLLRKIDKYPDSFSIIVLPNLKQIDDQKSSYGFSKEIIITKADFENLDEKLLEIRNFVLSENNQQPKKVQLGKEEILHLKEQLLPSHYLPNLKTYINERGERIQELDFYQIERWRDCLDQRNPTIIEGQNGSGKTILARALAKQRAERGLKTILICKQLLLNQENKYQLRDTMVESYSYFELLFWLIENLDDEELSEDHIFKFVASKINDKKFNIHKDFESDVYKHIADKSGYLFELYSGSYDALIIDEGQQFNEEQFTNMRKLLNNESKDTITVFADKFQAEDLTWEPPKWLNTYPPLLKNYRNTDSIVKHQEAILDKRLEESENFGPLPQFIFLDSEKNFYNEMINQWNQIRKIGVPEKSIIVLSTSRTLIDSMLSICVKEKTISPKQFFTVEEFTGLEKFAVILLWSNDMTAKFSEEDRLRRAYQGTGRAKEILRIISTTPSSEFYKNEKYLKEL